MMSVEQSVERLAGETEVFGENHLSAALSTTNPTRLDPGSNQGRCCGMPANNRLSYDKAFGLSQCRKYFSVSL
jgi:hypothetical protein